MRQQQCSNQILELQLWLPEDILLFNFPACILLALEDGFSSIHIFPCLSLLGEKWYCLFPKLYVSKVSMYLRASASHLVLVFQFLSTSLCFQKMFVPEHVCETSCNTSKTSCSTSRCTQPMQLIFFQEAPCCHCSKAFSHGHKLQ